MTSIKGLGARITQAREARQLSISDAAQLIAVSPKTLRTWEKDGATPRPTKLQMLAGVLGVPLLWLIGGGEAFDAGTRPPDRLEQLARKMRTLDRLQRRAQAMSKEIAADIAAIREDDGEARQLAS